MLQALGIMIAAVSIGWTESALTAVPDSVVDGVLTVCPGTSISLTCSYAGGGELTRWEFTGSTTCIAIVTHNPPTPATCESFTINMVSTHSDTTRNSTAQATATEMLDGVVVVCREGGLIADPVGGNVTVRVYDPTAVLDSVVYFVDSSLTGGVSFAVSSPRAYSTGVEYEGSVTGGSVVVTGGSVSVTGLDYTQNHSISITANSTVCSEVSTMAFPVSLNTARLSVSEPVASVTCSDPSLPIQLSWTVDTGVQSTTDPATPLTPPVTGPPVITFTTPGGERVSVSSSSPYILPNPTVNDVYTFTVSVRNIAGVTTMTSSPIRAIALVVDISTVRSMSCLTVTISEFCSEDITSGNFSVLFQRGVGDCRTISDREFSTSTLQLTTRSTCLFFNGRTDDDLCYRVTLLHQGNVIDSQTNLNFNNCSVSEIESLLGAGVSYQLDGPVGQNGTVPRLSTAALTCSLAIFELSGTPQANCIDGSWSTSEMRICEVTAWLIALIVFLILIVTAVLVAIGVTVYCCYRHKTKASLDLNQLGPVYEEPDDIKPDPHTEGNLAYGHVQRKKKQKSSQPPTELKKPLYKVPDFKPDPHTEGNLAYGHVQRKKKQNSSQPPTELKKPLYEEPDFKPDPHTQENMAYGQVMLT